MNHSKKFVCLTLVPSSKEKDAYVQEVSLFSTNLFGNNHCLGITIFFVLENMKTGNALNFPASILYLTSFIVHLVILLSLCSLNGAGIL